MEKSEMVSRNQRRKQKQTHQQPQIWGARLSPQTKSTTAPRTSNHRPQAYLPLPPDWPPTTPILTYHCSKTEKLMPPGWPLPPPPHWPTTTPTLSYHNHHPQTILQLLWGRESTTPSPTYHHSHTETEQPPLLHGPATTSAPASRHS